MAKGWRVDEKEDVRRRGSPLIVSQVSMGRKKVFVERFWGMGNREKKGSLMSISFIVRCQEDVVKGGLKVSYTDISKFMHHISSCQNINKKASEQRNTNLSKERASKHCRPVLLKLLVKKDQQFSLFVCFLFFVSAPPQQWQTAIFVKYTVTCLDFTADCLNISKCVLLLSVHIPWLRNKQFMDQTGKDHPVKEQECKAVRLGVRVYIIYMEIYITLM